MKLGKLSEEQLTYLHAQRVRGFTVASSWQSLRSRWPDAEPYQLSTITDYLESEEGQARSEAVLKDVREKAMEYAYADRGSRLDVLNERAISLANQLRDLENPPISDEQRVAINMGTRAKPAPDPKTVALLNGELRQTLAAMQKETDPLAGGESALAPALIMFREMQRLGVTPAEQRAAMEADEAAN